MDVAKTRRGKRAGGAAMLFGQTAEYALRAMAQLALLPAGTFITGRELSASTGIPSEYVSKVLRRLVQNGLLHAQKGHGGGFQLARPAAQISFLQILEAMDERLENDRCSFGWGSCDPAMPCALHGAFTRLKGAVLEWARSTTLADVLPVRRLLPVLPAAAR